MLLPSPRQPALPEVAPPRSATALPLGDVAVDLHRRCSSIRATSGPMRGRVIAKSLRTLVFDVTFRVQASGRDRARREGHRNVHAFARGRWLAEADLAAVLGHPGAVRIRYDPLLFDTFVRADTLEPVHHARMLAIDGTVAWAVRA